MQVFNAGVKHRIN